MSTDDDGLYRGDPPPDPRSSGTGQPHPGPPPGYSPPPGYGRPGYGPPGYPPGWAPPPYGTPPYGPPPGGPGYGYPGYGGAPGYPYGRPTNSLAILSLVLAFVFAPAGLITGIIARRQIRETHEEGDGLALAGIVVGGIATGVVVVVILFWLFAFAAVTGSV